MFCTNCGTKNVDSAKFCSSCGTELINPATKDDISQSTVAEAKQQATIKCGNCGYIGEGESARRPIFTILAWVCVLFAPLLTILYYVATSKYRCPKCRSTFLGIKNKEGVFVGQRGSTSRAIWILVIVLVSIAVVGVLSSIVLASLNSARMKSRDARRITDIKQLQLALELYYDANGNRYPNDLSSLSPKFIPSSLNDPSGGSYAYYTCSSQSYHIGASLEENNLALNNDGDLAPMCNGDRINGLDSNKCSPSDTGLHCYDEGEQLSKDISSESSAYTYYTNAVASLRSCPATSCEVVGEYRQNVEFSLPHPPHEMPEWVAVEWLNDEGETGIGYMHQSVFSPNQTY